MDTLQKIKAIGKFLTITLFFMLFVTPAYSGQVGYPDDSYTAGDPLTAADLNLKFNEIKADVNDNDTRTGANETQLSNAATGCPANQSIRAIAVDGTITCEIDTNTNTNHEGVDFTNSSADIAVTSTPVTLLSVAVTAPVDGFVIVSFSSTARINHTSGTSEFMRLWLSTSPTAPNAFDETWRYHDVTSTAATDTYWVTQHSQNVYPVTAGTTTFYARGDSNQATGTIYRNSSIQAIFVPNRY